MVNTVATGLTQPAAVVDPAQYDITGIHAVTGGLAMSRHKRDGRNPSTGARGSRRYGQTITFITGLNPLSTIPGTFIY